MSDITEEMKKRLLALLHRGVITEKEYERARRAGGQRKTKKEKN